MIASKGQLVKPIGQTEVAKVISVLASGPGYECLPEGQRGVKLDKPLNGSVWATEDQLEGA